MARSSRSSSSLMVAVLFGAACCQLLLTGTTIAAQALSGEEGDLRLEEVGANMMDSELPTAVAPQRGLLADSHRKPPHYNPCPGRKIPGIIIVRIVLLIRGSKKRPATFEQGQRSLFVKVGEAYRRFNRRAPAKDTYGGPPNQRPSRKDKKFVFEFRLNIGLCQSDKEAFTKYLKRVLITLKTPSVIRSKVEKFIPVRR